MDWQSSMRTNYQKGQAAERANTLKEKERADSEKRGRTKLRRKSKVCCWKLRGVEEIAGEGAGIGGLGGVCLDESHTSAI